MSWSTRSRSAASVVSVCACDVDQQNGASKARLASRMLRIAFAHEVRSSHGSVPRLTRQMSDFRHRAYRIAVIRATRGTPVRFAGRRCSGDIRGLRPFQLHDPTDQN